MATEPQTAQTLSFETEVKQLLHLVIHSLYSNKEIFLRELVSNSSDALNKLRFAAVENNKLYENQSDLNIRVFVNKENKTIHIQDNGIGMTREEAIRNLGTIAKSGTKEFLERLSGDQSKDNQLIGQFGVGFYAAFIVAEKVAVLTRKAGEPADSATCWTSKGEGDYTIEPYHKADRGTEVILYLKENELEFLESWRLRSIIHKYSDHIPFPILMQKEAGDKKENAETTTPEWETANKATALWRLAKSEITDQDYNEFYKQIAFDFQDPLIRIHKNVEGKRDFTFLIYVPSAAPFDLWNREKPRGLKLYVQRVFIMDDAEQFLPMYLRFVKGVIDSNDLPLNVSREILQANPLIDAMRSAVVKAVLEGLQKLAQDDTENYQKFWNAFGNILKEGPVEDFSNKEAIAKLMRFASTHGDSSVQNVSFDNYIQRMPASQDKIYYVTAESYNAARYSPHLEIFKKKGIEVLLLTDRIDEWLVGHLSEYQGKTLCSVAKDNLDLGELADKTDEEELKRQEADFESLLSQMKTALTDRVKDVKITHRLTDSPACVVSDSGGMSSHLQRIMKASGQAMGPMEKPILEINPDHGLIGKLRHESDDDRFKEMSLLLLDQAILAEGGQLEEPGLFVQRLNKFLLQG